MNKLKYDFINDQHERMHNTLLRAGWTCENDYLLNNNRHYSCDWFYSKDNFILFFNNDYQKVQTINLKKLDDLSFSEVADISEKEMEEKQPEIYPGLKIDHHKYGICKVESVSCGNNKNEDVVTLSHLTGREIICYARGEAYKGVIPHKITISLPLLELEEIMKDKSKEQPKDFSHVKIGQWVRSLNKTDNREVNKWYKCSPSPHSNGIYFTSDNCEYISYDVEGWDLTDIRDTNPDEETKQDKDMQERYLITKDNIVEVLEYNNIYTSIYSGIDYLILNKGEECQLIVNINHPNLIQTIEAHYGIKLNPIPKPKFDFVKYLLDNGWTSNNHNSACLSSKRKTMMIVIKDYKFHHYDNSKQMYDCSEYNAKILVEMSNLGEKFQVSKEME